MSLCSCPDSGKSAKKSQKAFHKLVLPFHKEDIYVWCPCGEAELCRKRARETFPPHIVSSPIASSIYEEGPFTVPFWLNGQNVFCRGGGCLLLIAEGRLNPRAPPNLPLSSPPDVSAAVLLLFSLCTACSVCHVWHSERLHDVIGFD